MSQGESEIFGGFTVGGSAQTAVRIFGRGLCEAVIRLARANEITASAALALLDLYCTTLKDEMTQDDADIFQAARSEINLIRS